MYAFKNFCVFMVIHAVAEFPKKTKTKTETNKN